MTEQAAATRNRGLSETKVTQTEFDGQAAWLDGADAPARGQSVCQLPQVAEKGAVRTSAKSSLDVADEVRQRESANLGSTYADLSEGNEHGPKRSALPEALAGYAAIRPLQK